MRKEGQRRQKVLLDVPRGDQRELLSVLAMRTAVADAFQNALKPPVKRLPNRHSTTRIGSDRSGHNRT